MQVAWELAHGLKVLHDRDVVVASLNPHTICFDDNHRLVICDAGVPELAARMGIVPLSFGKLPFPPFPTPLLSSVHNASKRARLRQKSRVKTRDRLRESIHVAVNGSVAVNQRSGRAPKCAFSLCDHSFAVVNLIGGLHVSVTFVGVEVVDTCQGWTQRSNSTSKHGNGSGVWLRREHTPVSEPKSKTKLCHQFG